MDLQILIGILKKNLLTQYRAYPMSFFVGNILTGLYTVLGAWFMYKLLFEGRLSSDFFELTKTNDYMGYVIVGSLTYLFVVRTCLNVSRSLITELREGTLEALMLAPFKRVEYFLGNMLVQTMTTTMEIVISLFIAIPFGLNLSNINLSGFIVSFFIALYAFFGVSMILGCIMLYTRDTYISQNTLFAFLFLVSGITFPTKYLPEWLNICANFIPITEGVILIRNTALLGMGIEDLLYSYMKVFVLSTIYIIVGFGVMKRCEEAALEKING
ncbi:ABC-2 type transport system permease protein [Mobilisporobacter senegalensis]|uniref:Transport permease protein n=1 Tax=Mobilisporobacter senegalensis TaxID=1329262 RepID=A0A3N1XK99_9FIRM|nr:ABC transporter permease [Mobilisporobacter senegalensis]ROR27155.1 ABC-2 type transport system permease protein [Mobilisporobacter senegalensis]